MPDAITANITFIAVERKDTRNGKARWIGRTGDGREFGIWDQAQAEAVGAHLHEDLLCEVTSRQDDRGNWWNNLQALPGLGLVRPPRQDGANQSSAPPAVGTQLDLTELVRVGERIALALDNLLAFEMDKYLAQSPGDSAPKPLQAVQDDDGPPEPEGV